MSKRLTVTLTTLVLKDYKHCLGGITVTYISMAYNCVVYLFALYYFII